MGQSGISGDKKNIFVNDILIARRHSRPVIMSREFSYLLGLVRVIRVNIEIPFFNYITRDFCLCICMYHIFIDIRMGEEVIDLH